MHWTAAHLAVEHEDIEALRRAIAETGDVEDPDSTGMTLLHHAIDAEGDGALQTGEPLSVEMTRLLVDRGADVNRRWQGQTPLELAKVYGHHLAVDVLTKAGARASAQDGT